MASCASSSGARETQRDVNHGTEDETAKTTWSSSVVLKRRFPLVSQLLQLQKVCYQMVCTPNYSFLVFLQDADLNHAPPDWLSRQSSAGQYFPHSLFSLFQPNSVQSRYL